MTDIVHHNIGFKDIFGKSALFIFLLILNWVIVVFSTAFVMGMTDSAAPVVVALGFIGGVVWLQPINYLFLQVLFNR